MTRKTNQAPDLAGAAKKWERKRTLLFVDYAAPQYDQFAGSRTNFMYLEVLVALGLDVKFLPADFQRVEPYSSELNKMGIETLDGEWFEQNWENWLREHGQGIDYVFFHKPDPAASFLPAVLRCTNAAIIYQCHDLHYLRLQRKAELENKPEILEEAQRYEQKEDFIFANSDVILTFSETEERFIKAKLPHKKVFTVPLFFYRDVRTPPRDFSQRQGLLFVGSCAHSPNGDAIAWFSEQVLPLVTAHIPDIVFNVVGANPSAEISALQSDSIRILGSLSEKDLQDLYDSTRIMVVPLRFGAGVKGKVIETLYHGVPLVSTAIGLEGIGGIDPLATPRDSVADFAAEVVALYQDESELERLSQLGTTFVEDHFTFQNTSQLMANILDVSQQEAAARLAAETTDDSLPPPRLIAFYLPQYHPIQENDEWWGEGFTEWHNVSKAEPLFSGHYQPHVPADLGYYDLRDEATRVAQAELAKQYGIEGFCYYHYWFNGHRLLERPLEDMLSSGKPDFPFCICWANENWTRRWDGEDQQVLIKQDYSEADDRRHIQSLLPVFEDPRYIRINGKPLFLVYRTENLPDAARTAEIWRAEARTAGLGELHLCRVESMDKGDPVAINFDSALEFAPDWWNKGPRLQADAELLAGAEGAVADVCANNFVHSYQALSDTMMAKAIPPYKWLRCVMPSWDNWARRTQGASIFLGSTPEKYQAWLGRAIANTDGRLLGEERLVFINAWNEWAEGNHLEPDQKFGHGYLEATRKALEDSQRAAGSRHAGASDEVRIGRLHSQVVNLKYRVNELQAQVDVRDQQLQEILASTSWRASAPVRWAKQAVLDLKKRFSG